MTNSEIAELGHHVDMLLCEHEGVGYTKWDTLPLDYKDALTALVADIWVLAILLKVSSNELPMRSIQGVFFSRFPKSILKHRNLSSRQAEYDELNEFDRIRLRVFCDWAYDCVFADSPPSHPEDFVKGAIEVYLTPTLESKLDSIIEARLESIIQSYK